MKTTIRPRMMRIWRFSSISLMKWSFRKSRVRVELEASTREDRVDMEADSTSTTTTLIRKSPMLLDSMAGTMPSYAPAAAGSPRTAGRMRR